MAAPGAGVFCWVEGVADATRGGALDEAVGVGALGTPAVTALANPGDVDALGASLEDSRAGASDVGEVVDSTVAAGSKPGDVPLAVEPSSRGSAVRAGGDDEGGGLGWKITARGRIAAPGAGVFGGTDAGGADFELASAGADFGAGAAGRASTTSGTRGAEGIGTTADSPSGAGGNMLSAAPGGGVEAREVGAPGGSEERASWTDSRSRSSSGSCPASSIPRWTRRSARSRSPLDRRIWRIAR